MLNAGFKIWIGIDPGTETGFAIWSKPEKKFIDIKTLRIHRAMARVLELVAANPGEVFVRFEDSRLRKWFQNKTPESIQGAGSIKRDCCIWQEFLEDHKIPYSSNHPGKGMTKWKPEIFKQSTKYEGITSHHGRDAALLVFGK